jgi:hypothetical protein
MPAGLAPEAENVIVAACAAAIGIAQVSAAATWATVSARAFKIASSQIVLGLYQLHCSGKFERNNMSVDRRQLMPAKTQVAPARSN